MNIKRILKKELIGSPIGIWIFINAILLIAIILFFDTLYNDLQSGNIEPRYLFLDALPLFFLIPGHIFFDWLIYWGIKDYQFRISDDDIFFKSSRILYFSKPKKLDVHNIDKITILNNDMVVVDYKKSGKLKQLYFHIFDLAPNLKELKKKVHGKVKIVTQHYDDYIDDWEYYRKIISKCKKELKIRNLRLKKT